MLESLFSYRSVLYQSCNIINLIWPFRTWFFYKFGDLHVKLVYHPGNLLETTKKAATFEPLTSWPDLPPTTQPSVQLLTSMRIAKDQTLSLQNCCFAEKWPQTSDYNHYCREISREFPVNYHHLRPQEHRGCTPLCNTGWSGRLSSTSTAKNAAVIAINSGVAPSSYAGPSRPISEPGPLALIVPRPCPAVPRPWPLSMICLWPH